MLAEREVYRMSSLSLEAAAAPVSSYHLLDPLSEGGGGVCVTLSPSFSPSEVIRQQICLEADRLR
jgi:hypothetical protein